MTHLITKDNQKNAIKTHVDCITLQIIAKILWLTPYIGTLGGLPIVNQCIFQINCKIEKVFSG